MKQMLNRWMDEGKNVDMDSFMGGWMDGCKGVDVLGEGMKRMDEGKNEMNGWIKEGMDV